MTDRDPLFQTRIDGKKRLTEFLDKLRKSYFQMQQRVTAWGSHMDRFDEEISRAQCILIQFQEAFDEEAMKLGYVPPTSAMREGSTVNPEGTPVSPCEEV